MKTHTIERQSYPWLKNRTPRKCHDYSTWLPLPKYGGRSLPVKMEFFLATVAEQLSQGFLFNAFALRRLLVPLDSKYIKLRSVSPEQSPVNDGSSLVWSLLSILTNQHLLWAPSSSWGDWGTGPALCLLLPVGDTGESLRKGCVGARGSIHAATSFFAVSCVLNAELKDKISRVGEGSALVTKRNFKCK